ncbi:hypothetical protein VPH35_123321 [Triticum aestivum]
MHTPGLHIFLTSQGRGQQLSTDRPADELRNEHIKIAHGLMACIAKYFDGRTPKAKGWQNWFPKAHQRPLGLQQLGDEIYQSRMILLYEALGLAGNIGQLPAKFKMCQTDC